jgi:hypothetical protein
VILGTSGTLFLVIVILLDIAIFAPIGWCLWTALHRNLKAKDIAWRLIVFSLGTFIFDISIPIFTHDFIIEQATNFCPSHLVS